MITTSKSPNAVFTFSDAQLLALAKKALTLALSAPRSKKKDYQVYAQIPWRLIDETRALLVEFGYPLDCKLAEIGKSRRRDRRIRKKERDYKLARAHAIGHAGTNLHAVPGYVADAVKKMKLTRKQAQYLLTDVTEHVSRAQEKVS